MTDKLAGDTKCRPAPVSGNADTVAVLLTGAGRGAIATVLVEGPRATELVLRFFRSAHSESPAELPRDVIRFGRWQGRHSNEELVVCRTAAAQIEIHCHGGRLASRSILDALVTVGATELSVNQWLERHLEDPSLAAARRLLAAARTERTTTVLLDQLRGAMRRELTRIIELLESHDAPVAMHRLRRLLDYSSVGLHLATPWSVVVAGRPNAGKSSLINGLLGYHRAVVFDQPGTTRDLVSAETAIDGWPVTLTDTAGLRDSQDPIEVQGMELARSQLERADLIVWVHDGTHPRDHFAAPRATSTKRIHVMSKADLVTEQPETEATWTSTVTGQGIQELLHAIATTLVPHPPPPGAAVPVCPELAARLESVYRYLDQGNTAKAVDLMRSEL